MKFTSAQSSRLGNRKINQDRCTIFTREQYTLLVLADGMGGHKGGEKAAQATIDTCEIIFNNICLPIRDPRTFIEQLAKLAHKAIQEDNKNEVDIPRTTFVCCLIKGNSAIWAHTGDSRLYLFREGDIHTRTRDHSYIQDLLQLQTMTEKEASTHPMRNYVTACLGGPGDKLHVSISRSTELKNMDIILLCSDGLWSAVNEKQMISTLHADSVPLEQSLDQLTNLADNNSYPKSDNTTAVAIYIEDCNPSTGVIVETLRPTRENAGSPLEKAIDEIETAYDLYKSEIK